MTTKAECDFCGLLFDPEEVEIGKRGKYCGKHCKALAETKKSKPAAKPVTDKPEPPAPAPKASTKAAAPDPRPPKSALQKAKERRAKPKLAPKPEARIGRPPYPWTPEIEDEILMRMAEGESLRSICSDERLPSRITVRMRAIDDAAFSARYARARELQADELIEEAREIADTTAIGIKTKETEDGFEIVEADMIEHRKLQIDIRKWQASKLHPKSYGDKIDVNHAGKVAVEQVKVSFEDAGDSQDE